VAWSIVEVSPFTNIKPEAFLCCHYSLLVANKHPRKFKAPSSCRQKILPSRPLKQCKLSVSCNDGLFCRIGGARIMSELLSFCHVSKSHIIIALHADYNTQRKMKFPVSTFSFFFAATVQVNIAGAFIPEPKLLDIDSIAKSSSSLAKPIIPSSPTDASNNAQTVKKVPDIKYKKWGVDNTNEDEYWFDSRIHTLGNCGFMGAVSEQEKRMTAFPSFPPCIVNETVY
jgi:hypothetical protein